MAFHDDHFSATESHKSVTENWMKNSKNVTNSHLGQFSSKAPSKIHGPLVIYQNDDADHASKKDALGTLHKPKIFPEENIYYNQETTNPKTDIKIKPAKDKNLNYINPSKPDKVGNKKTPLFVTPPPPSIQSDNHIPPSPGKNPFLNIPQNAINSEIEIHGHGNPEELLQFINQHPEISNYPSGSVLEIHKVSPPVNQKPPVSLTPDTNSHIHLVPYLVQTNSAGETNQNNLPPGFSLDHILNEFHKNTKPHTNVNFATHPSFVNNKGPVIVPQQTGPVIFSNRNNSHKG